MKTLACDEGSHEEVNNGTTVPLKKSPFRAFSSHPFHGWLLTSGLLNEGNVFLQVRQKTGFPQAG
jgi:hypothetical protein